MNEVLCSLGFRKVTYNIWILDKVLNNDIHNSVAKNLSLKFLLSENSEPFANKIIVSTIEDRLSIRFEYENGCHNTDVVFVESFDKIFSNLLRERRDKTIKEIIK